MRKFIIKLSKVLSISLILLSSGAVESCKQGFICRAVFDATIVETQKIFEHSGHSLADVSIDGKCILDSLTMKGSTKSG